MWGSCTACRELETAKPHSTISLTSRVRAKTRMTKRKRLESLRQCRSGSFAGSCDSMRLFAAGTGENCLRHLIPRAWVSAAGVGLHHACQIRLTCNILEAACLLSSRAWHGLTFPAHILHGLSAVPNPFCTC